ncbi:MAG: lipase [Oscillospiraceae bacterium]|jgi:triacylglycerol lipase|nr:lipase [Oscillospiraceae bacterium]
MKIISIRSFALLFALRLSLFALPGCTPRPAEAAPPVTYPYVFVHGLGGFGEDAGSPIPYFGATAGALLPMLREKGYACYAPSVSPFSSAWDRACELYAQLAGGTVDYGAAHSAACGHERYGETYATPLFDGWGGEDALGRVKKVNLIGHSFGGATIRLLASLLAQGNAQEQAAAPGDCSPLFLGGRGGWVFSVTTLAAPHDGVSLIAAIDANPLIALGAGLLGETALAQGVLGALREQGFALEGMSVSDIINASKKLDTAYYDLHLPGARELNKSMVTLPETYYFSYAVDGTTLQEDGRRVPGKEMIAILRLTGGLMADFTGEVDGIVIDDAWRANDGLVNTISAQSPWAEPSQVFTQALAPERLLPGRWYIMPTERGDHASIVGFGKDSAWLDAFYSEILARIDALSARQTLQ